MSILPDAKTKITIVEQAYRLKVQDADVLAKIARDALDRAEEAERRLADLLKPQPCGHPRAVVVGECKMYCGWCVSLEQARKEGREQWCMPAEWNPLMEALARLSEVYYSKPPDVGVVKDVSDALQALMEVYDEWVK